MIATESERRRRAEKTEERRREKRDTTEWATSRVRQGRNSLKHFCDSRALAQCDFPRIAVTVVLEQISSFRTLLVPEVSFSPFISLFVTQIDLYKTDATVSVNKVPLNR